MSESAEPRVTEPRVAEFKIAEPEVAWQDGAGQDGAEQGHPEQEAPARKSTRRSTGKYGVPQWRVGKPDAILAQAKDLARDAVLSIAAAEQVGEHMGAKSEGERTVTHLFTSKLPGYRGWQWFATLSRVPRGKVATVCEVGMVPTDDAVLAPEWLPWSKRVRPGDQEALDSGNGQNAGGQDSRADGSQQPAQQSQNPDDGAAAAAGVVENSGSDDTAQDNTAKSDTAQRDNVELANGAELAEDTDDADDANDADSGDAPRRNRSARRGRGRGRSRRGSKS